MHLDPLLIPSLIVVCALTALGLAFRMVRLPASVGYIFAGALLGPAALGVIADPEFAARIGALGVVLLLFLAATEISPREFVDRWRVAIVGTFFQISITVLLVLAIGEWLDWPLVRSLVIGFALSNSSTIIVVDVLQRTGRFDHDSGRNALLILLAQDIAVIPMILIIGWFDPDVGMVDVKQLALQLTGAAALLGVLYLARRHRPIRLPFNRILDADNELQVLLAIILCFGLAAIAGLFGLSTAFGAFVAGLLVRYVAGVEWLPERLHAFQVLFICAFFVSIGLLVDFAFVMENLLTVIGLSLFVLFASTFLNGAVLLAVGVPWRTSFVTGAMLAQIGEFSFVIATLGRSSGAIGAFGYKMTIVVIALTMIASSLWIAGARRLLERP